MSTIEITGYVPGAIGRMTEFHGTYYSTHWNLGMYFEAKAAAELGAFLCRFDPAHDGFWVARDGAAIIGGIAIDGVNAASEGARLRWFFVEPEYQGMGLGKRLINNALDFCRSAGFHRVYLTTFAGLDAARHLYEQAGFRLCHEQVDSHWGQPLTEQVFELNL